MLSRFRAVVAVGVALTLMLAFLSIFRMEWDGFGPQFVYRSSPTWSSTSTVLVTEPGFPVGRTLLEEEIRDRKQSANAPRFSDPGRFSGLAVVYSRLIGSDAVRRLVGEDATEAVYGAEPVRTPDGVLPFITITALADSPAGAVDLAKRVTRAFQEYLARHQAANGIRPQRRVQVPIVDRPDGAELYEGRSMTRPILIIFIGLSLTVLLAFILENLRPRARPIAPPLPHPSAEPSPGRAARTG